MGLRCGRVCLFRHRRTRFRGSRAALAEPRGPKLNPILVTNGFAEPIPAASDEGWTRGPLASTARALPAGARLDEFEVDEVIGEGSVGIVYAATDRVRSVPVAIAEYIPARLAERDDEAQVGPRTSPQADAFAKGLEAFINDTRTLIRCDHPSLVRIVRLCEANSTAYRVMPRYPTKRLLEVRLGMNAPPTRRHCAHCLTRCWARCKRFTTRGRSRQGHAVQYLAAGRQPTAAVGLRCSRPGNRHGRDRRAHD